jgi:hypothetical protein
MKLPEVCQNTTDDTSGYSLPGSSTSRLVPNQSQTCFANPVSARGADVGNVCTGDIKYASGEFVGPMVTDVMNVDDMELSVDFFMPVQAFDCSLGNVKLLGMNQGKASFASQAYDKGYIDELVVGFCGSRGVNGTNEPFMALGSAASLHSIGEDGPSMQGFPVYNGSNLSVRGKYAELARNISKNGVEKEHYYTLIDAVAIGNDTFDSPENPLIAIIDSGWTDLAMPTAMTDSLAQHINNTLKENNMDEDIDLIDNPDQPYPKGCVSYNASLYPDSASLARLIYPRVNVTIEGGATVTIDLSETAFFALSDTDTIMCANVMARDNRPLMLGVPFFLNRYIELHPREGQGYFSNEIQCDKVSEMVQSTKGTPTSSSTSSLHWVVISLAMMLFVDQQW